MIPRFSLMLCNVALCVMLLMQQAKAQEPTTDKEHAASAVAPREDVKLTEEETKRFDEVFTFFYLDPSPEKVGILLDMINETNVLRIRSSHPPISAFLSMVFSANTELVYSWMSRNDYNRYAQDVITNSLVNAGLKRDAYIFAEAHGWADRSLALLDSAKEEYDFETMGIYNAGHIDVLWALFSATGKESYVQRIIDYIFFPAPLESASDDSKEIARITLQRALWSLQSNAVRHEEVRRILESRIANETDPQKKEVLSKIMNPGNEMPGRAPSKKSKE